MPRWSSRGKRPSTLAVSEPMTVSVCVSVSLYLCLSVCLSVCLPLWQSVMLHLVSVQVFLPSDPPNLWLLAKMFYNNAEAQHHESLTHLGFTHLLMEGVVICTHRHLAVSHPLFRLMAPHFLFLLSINVVALQDLIAPGKWIDRVMTVRASGLQELARRG